MFATRVLAHANTDVGRTSSPRRSKTESQPSVAPGLPRCHPEPGPDAFVGDAGEGSAVRRARRVWAVLAAHANKWVRAVLAAHCRSDYPLTRPSTGPTRTNPIRMNTYPKCSANPRGMNTYKIIEPKSLKASWNEHLRKKRGGGGLIVTQLRQRDMGVAVQLLP